MIETPGHPTRRDALTRLSQASVVLGTMGVSALTVSRAAGQIPNTRQKPITTLHVDGKLYTEDQLSEDSSEELRNVPFLAVTPEGLKASTAFAFTSQKAIEHWVAQSKLSSVYSQITKAMSDIAYAPERESRLAKENATRINEDTQRFLGALKQNSVAANDAAGILRLFSENKLGRSMVLWRYPNYSGRVRYFSGSHPVPFYGWIDFNNMASSAVHAGGGTALFQYRWFDGRVIFLFGVISVSHLGEAPYYFNNLASSSAACCSV